MKKRHLLLPIPIVGLLLILVFIFSFRVAAIISQIVLESPQFEMRSIPPNIKKPATKELPLKVPILIYHYVEYVEDQSDKGRLSLNILPSVLDLQIKTLQDAGYNFITPQDLSEMLDHKRPIHQSPIILSFDDGYRDFYTDVLPIIKKHHIRVVAYIVPGLLNQKNWLTTQQLHQVKDSGLVEIGAHTMHHLYLKGINKKIVEYEVNESKRQLEKELGVTITTFAYPYGAFDQPAIDIVKGAGFKNAVSTVPGVLQSNQNRYFLFRIHPGARTGKNLLNYLNQNRFNF